MEIKNYPLQIIRGIPFSNFQGYKKKDIEDAMDYKPKDNDLIIASYPKSGTFWLQYIVLQIISKGTLFPTYRDLVKKIVPNMMMVGISTIETTPEPRIFRHHIPYNMVQKNSKAKYLYIYRNPEDVAVSLYGFLQGFNEDMRINFDNFFECFMTGNVISGCHFQHVLSYYEHQNDTNLLLVSYEKLHANTKEEILRIAEFLGEEHHQNIVKDDALMLKILENTSFKHMKKNVSFDFTHSQNISGSVVVENKTLTSFCRKGIVGDGKNVLTDFQRTRIREKVEKMMKDTSIGIEWMKYLRSSKLHASPC